MIKIQNLKKVYKDCVALDTVSMHIRKGEFVAIIGASGSGKTTMLNIIGGLDTDYMGSCVVRNKEISSLSDVECCTLRSRYISYVYQFFNLISFLTVKENVCLASQIKGKKVDEKELNQVLKLLGLEQKKIALRMNCLEVNNSALRFLERFLHIQILYWPMSQREIWMVRMLKM